MNFVNLYFGVCINSLNDLWGVIIFVFCNGKVIIIFKGLWVESFVLVYGDRLVVVSVIKMVISVL